MLNIAWPSRTSINFEHKNENIYAEKYAENIYAEKQVVKIEEAKWTKRKHY